jgi:hypothetical protein
LLCAQAVAFALNFFPGIVKFYLYRLTVENIETYMVVMRNIFSSHMRIHKKYDLKGSTIDREVRNGFTEQL